MKRFFGLFLSLILIMGVFLSVPVTVNAASSGTCGTNLTWNFAEGVLTISGTGEMRNYYYSEYPWANNGLSQKINSVIICSGVTTIGEYAFYECENLTNITIPDTITYIGERAFNKSTDLTDVYITDVASWCNIKFSIYEASNPLFCAPRLYLNGELVKDLIIPDGVVEIPLYAFSSKSITSVTIPDSVTSIDHYAFYNCTSLADVYITDVASWCDIDFGDGANPLYYSENLYLNGELVKDLIIPDGVVEIPSYAFSSKSITSVTIPDSVTSINNYAFYNCTSLVDVYITDVASWCDIDFGNYANPLYYSENLYLNGELVKDLIIPDGVVEIPSYAFSSKSITSVTIPDSVLSIGAHAFGGCESLVTITIGDSVSTIGVCAFAYCESLISITIPDSVTSIGRGAFSNCGSMVSITIGRGLKSISDQDEGMNGETFGGCESLRSVYITDLEAWCNISFPYRTANPLSYAENLYINGDLATDLVVPDGVTSIGEYTFGCCESFKTITIPDSVTSIGCFNFSVAINVSENNSVYSSVDGVLFDKNKKTLIKYPASKPDIIYEIPSSVKKIEEGAFEGADLSTLILNTEMANIKKGSFTRCDLLKCVVVPLNVITINNGAFDWCYDIKDIFYEGDINQWDNIAIAANNGNFEDARVHYNVDIANYKNHYGEPLEVTQPTCTSAGVNNYVCDCGYELQEYFSNALGHDYSTEFTIDREPDCNSFGWKSRHCSRCNSTTDEFIIPFDSSRHTPSDWITDKEATVNATGSQHKECTECGEVLETAVIPQLAPETPDLVSVANTTSGVKFTWSETEGADSYIVYRRAYNTKTKKWGGWTRIADDVTTTSYVDKTAKSGYYRYTVRAVNEGGTSGYDTNGLKTYFLATPKVTSTANTNSAITVKWGKVTGATGYIVYRKTGNGGWQKIATVKGTSTVKYLDKTAKKGVTYKYTVRAYYGTSTSYYNTKGLTIKDKY